MFDEDTIEGYSLLIKYLKKFILWIVLPIIIYNSIRSSIVYINPGEVGVVVNMMGSERGIDEQEITPGLSFIPPWKAIYLFPTFEQNHIWEKEKSFNFQTSEGLIVNADVGITYHLVQNKIHNLFNKYRKGLDEITDIFVRNIVRDSINRFSSKMKIESLYGTGKEKFFDDVLNLVREEVKELGIEVSHIYIVGQFHLPDNVVAALNKKIEATQLAQQRENELRQAEAEAKKQIAVAEGNARSVIIEAEAQKTKNDLINKTMSKELLLLNAIQQWDGKLPVMVGKEATALVPMDIFSHLNKGN